MRAEDTLRNYAIDTISTIRRILSCWLILVRTGAFDPSAHTSPLHSSDEWLALCRRYRDDALILQRGRRPDGAWLNAGFAVECCLKAAIMKKERLNQWPDKDSAPDLWTHDLMSLFKRLGVDPLKFDPKNPVAPALKTVLDWRREHGYSVGKLPVKFAEAMCRAAFETNGVVEWIAGKYRLNIRSGATWADPCFSRMGLGSGYPRMVISACYLYS